MNTDFLNLTAENITSEHLCCIIRSKKTHQGIEAKRQWLSERLKEGHVFRKLNEKATVFIEYAPLETAWAPIIGDNYYYLYCLWISSSHKGKGYGKSLMDYCLSDAKEKGKSGICMLGAKKQKSFLSDQSFAKKYGFEVVDYTDNGYELLALSFDGTTPKFARNVKNERIEGEELTLYYDMQCPYTYQSIEMIKQYCEVNQVPLSLIHVDTLEKAKELPCVFNNWAVFYKGKFETVNLLDISSLKRILEKVRKVFIEYLKLTNCNVLEYGKKYGNEKTKFILIEDVLLTGFEPKEVIMQGLRLSVECKGGQQRTLEEIACLFSTIGYRLEEKVIINSFHTMLTFVQL